EYTASAWPTLVLVDTRGKVVAQSSGEGAFAKFDAPIDELVRQAKATGKLDTRPLKLRLGRGPPPDAVLVVPGERSPAATSSRLFISDSNHNRIVVANMATGAVLEVVGSGAEGLTDGAFEKAAFHHPQGLALDGDVLYVADTENHAIRRVDLAMRKVDTIGG